MNDNLNSTKRDLIQAQQTSNTNEEEITTLVGQIANKEAEIEQEKKRYSNLESEIVSVAPFVIIKVEIGSTNKDGEIETEYGNTLYRNKVKYLKPKIYYKGFTSSSYTLYIKLYRPDGTMSRNNSISPYGYTYSDDRYFHEGSHDIQLSGWGADSVNHWETGGYRLEIWYDGKCHFLKDFTIY